MPGTDHATQILAAVEMMSNVVPVPKSTTISGIASARPYCSHAATALTIRSAPTSPTASNDRHARVGGVDGQRLQLEVALGHLLHGPRERRHDRGQRDARNRGRSTSLCSNSPLTKMPISSAVRSRSAARRQLCTRRSPSNTPMVTFVLPTSIASSMSSAMRRCERCDLFPAHLASQDALEPSACGQQRPVGRAGGDALLHAAAASHSMARRAPRATAPAIARGAPAPADRRSVASIERDEHLRRAPRQRLRRPNSLRSTRRGRQAPAETTHARRLMPKPNDRVLHAGRAG